MADSLGTAIRLEVSYLGIQPHNPQPLTHKADSQELMADSLSAEIQLEVNYLGIQSHNP